MNTLHEGVDEYVAMRRHLGYALREPARALHQFAAFVASVGQSVITTELALRWATQAAHVQPATQAWRLGVVRRFAAWRRATDPRTQVPPAGLLPARYRRTAPYLYRDDQIAALLQAAEQLAGPHGLRGRTYATLFGLLAVTGLRLSEALHLNADDIGWDTSVLTIRHTKFGKSRLVPVHASTLQVLREYADAKQRVPTASRASAFFVSDRGTRLTGDMARYTFAKVSRSIGLRGPVVAGRRRGRGPRLHDMRHRFAVQTLLNWYRAGADVEREIPKLATYLGHAHVNDTYWYLEAVPELLHLAAARLDRRCDGGWA